METDLIKQIQQLVETYKIHRSEIMDSYNRLMDKELFDLANVRSGSLTTIDLSISDLEKILKEHQGEARSVSSHKDEKEVCQLCQSPLNGHEIDCYCDDCEVRDKPISSDRSMRDES